MFILLSDIKDERQTFHSVLSFVKRYLDLISSRPFT